jgi:hypothetical protein
MREKYPRPWMIGPDSVKTVDYRPEGPSDAEFVAIIDANGEFMFSVMGADKARDILRIVNGDGPAAFDIDYSFSGLGRTV